MCLREGGESMFTDEQLLKAALELHIKCTDRMSCLGCLFHKKDICTIAHPFFWKTNYLKEEKNETVN